MDAKLLKNICSVVSPSGREEKVCNFILEEIKDYIDDYRIDALGNLIAHKKSDNPQAKKMMLAGHMDQIGMIITFIDEKGFLRFSNIGGLSPHTILHQRVVFDNGTIGVVACETLDDIKTMAIEKMYIDIGAKNEEEAQKYVSVGDMCVYAAEPIVDGTKVVSQALDDRIGCFIMIEALKKLKNPAFDCYFVFTVQEEVGLRGAKTSAYSVDPDYGIAFDVTLAYDTPKSKPFPMKMGSGAAIKVKDASLLCHPQVIKHMEDRAKEKGIPYQLEILTAGGTDVGAIHVSRHGVPSGAISVVTRYVHSPCEMCSITDIDNCVDLTVAVLEKEIGAVEA